MCASETAFSFTLIDMTQGIHETEGNNGGYIFAEVQNPEQQAIARP